MNQKAALSRLRLAITFYLMIFVGIAWDKKWHITNPFEDFFSPPHWLIYSMVAFTGLTIISIAFSERLRSAFGQPLVTIPLLKLPLPGPVAFALGGFIEVGAAGFFDMVWHTVFGLDETSFSFPHALLGLGLALLCAGLISCRLALRDHKPVWRITVFVFAFVLVGFADQAVNRISAPNAQFVQAIGRIPVLAQNADYQHLVRIQMAWHLYRSGNDFLMLLAPFASGVGLGLIVVILKNNRKQLLLYVLLITLITAYAAAKPYLNSPIIGDLRLWLPWPIFSAVVTYVVAKKLSVTENWSWALAGGVYALFVSIVYLVSPWLAFLAMPVMVGGVAAGKYIMEQMEKASLKGLIIVFGLGTLMIVIFGVFDLIMRTSTP